MKHLTLPVTLILALASTTVAQATLVVPHVYPTIQVAIDAAVNNDTVLVDTGTYVENIDVKGKDILIRSVTGADTTIIDGSNTATTVTFTAGSTRACVLEGFTIINGLGTGATTDAVGGGIRIHGASPTIRYCTVTNCATVSYGGGIGGTDFGAGGTPCAPLIEHCRITNNTATGVSFGSGGGIAITGFNSTAVAAVPEIRFCHFEGNQANTRGAATYFGYNHGAIIDSSTFCRNQTFGTSGNLDGGTAIFAALNAVCTITNNRIWANISNSNAAGIKYFNVTSVQIVNNTIVDNVGGSIGGFANAGAFGVNVSADVINTISYGNGMPEFAFTGVDQNGIAPFANVSYSDIDGGYAGTGNINVPPQLLNSGSGNHRLASTSPCRDMGDNTAAALPAVDFEGDLRVIGGTVDMGADEYNARAVLHWASGIPTISVSAPADVKYVVDGGVARAGFPFGVLFSLSGTDPGITFLGQHLPLNIDTLTTALTGLTGTLDPAGFASTVLPLGSVTIPPILIGRTLSSAAVVIGPGLTISFSNDENLKFVQ